MSRDERLQKMMALRKNQQQRPKVKLVDIEKQLYIEQLADDMEADNNEISLSSLDIRSSLLGDYELSNEFLSYLSSPIEGDPEKAKLLIKRLRDNFDSERFNGLIESTQKSIVHSIAVPFGLGKALSAYDKSGGNVTTVNNANQGVYAENDDKYNRSVYTNSPNSEGKKFEGQSKNSVGAKYTRSQMNENGMVEDAYTGQSQAAHTTSPDHIYSNSQYHKDGGFMQSSTQKANFATDEDNLAQTDRTINQSMRDFDKKEWQEKKTTDEKNSKRFNIDEQKLDETVKRGEQTAQKHLPSDIEKAQYYISNGVKTGITEGARMGFQQAVGGLLVEFMSLSFIEVKDLYKSGQQTDSLLSEIKFRITNVASKLKDSWKVIFADFGKGSLSGMLSNLVTVFVNMFITTGKRVVRMIREGFMSLLNALKVLLFPPENMSSAEACHESMKIVFGASTIVFGILCEEAVEKMLLSVPMLAPIAYIVSPVIVGSLTAICASLISYTIDRLDLLGAVEVKRNKFVLERLDEQSKETIERCDNLVLELDGYLTT